MSGVNQLWHYDILLVKARRVVQIPGRAAVVVNSLLMQAAKMLCLIITRFQQKRNGAWYSHMACYISLHSKVREFCVDLTDPYPECNIARRDRSIYFVAVVARPRTTRLNHCLYSVVPQRRMTSSLYMISHVPDMVFVSPIWKGPIIICEMLVNEGDRTAEAKHLLRRHLLSLER